MNEQHRENGYKVLLIICVIFSILMLFINYLVSKEIVKKETKLSSLKKNEKSKKEYSKISKYSDIINSLQCKEGVKTMKINDEKDKKITEIEVESNWDVMKTTDILKGIQIKEKPVSISKLSIEKDSENKVNTKINMEIAR